MRALWHLSWRAFTRSSYRARACAKSKGPMKKIILINLLSLLAVLMLLGCANKGAGPSSESDNPQIENAELIATAAAIELSGNKNGRAVMKEVSDALDVFCGQQEIDSLALVSLLKSKLGSLKDRRRVAILLLLINRAGAQINMSDYVQWGGFACKLRQGIKYGLELGEDI